MFSFLDNGVNCEKNLPKYTSDKGGDDVGDDKMH